MQRCIFVLVLAISSFFLAKIGHAGIVNSPQSYPFAAMNQSDDFILIGDWRMMIYWDGRFHVAPQISSNSRRAIFTGGIAERQDQDAAAIVCDGKEAFIYDPRRTMSTPNGQLKLIYSRTDRNSEIRCTMDQDGNWSILDLGQKTLISRRFGQQSITQDFHDAWLSDLDGDLLILTDRNQLLWQSAVDGSIKLQKSPFASFSTASRFIAKSGQLLYRNEFNLQIASYKQEQSRQKLVIDKIERVPISPCEDEQICSMSLGHDGSWLYMGYWGSYLGQGSHYERLPLLLETGKTAGTAIGHNSLSGKFIFTGPYDGDWGQMQDLQLGLQTQQQISSWEPILANPSKSRSESFAWMGSIQLTQAQSLVASTGLQPQEVIIGVVDSGIARQPARLQIHLREKELERSNGEDNDGNGFIDDIYGFDFIREKPEAWDSFGHGSHVAGLLASRLEDAPFSPASNGRLIVARALDQSGKSNALDLARAIYYLVDEGAQVLNLSWGGGRPSFALQDALQYAQKRGVIIFTSAGNDKLNHDEQPQVPGIYPGVISVGAVDQRGRVAGFSNYGAYSVSFLAPGSEVISSLKDGSLGAMTGTSMASPIAASSFAWLLGMSLELFPQLPANKRVDLVMEALCQTARPVGKAARCGLIQLNSAVNYLLQREDRN
ncbi:MAG: S8 family serine peptidase [Oligoflexus sp.]